jgi:hypothetical protein
MNTLFPLMLGLGLGAMLTNLYLNPMELQRSLSAKSTALESCTASLNEANQKMLGMLMNK